MTITDPENNRTIDPSTRLATTFTYNPSGQPLTATDPLGHTSAFEYDPQGNLTATSDPLSHRTERTYDSAGRLVSQTDPLGKTTQFSYDPLNRLQSLTDALNGMTRFGYDPNGNLLTVTDAKGHTLTHEYDSMDRLHRRIDPLGNAETFQYDGNGNVTSTTDRKTQTTTFTYDGLNRRTRAEFADGAVATATYDAGGRLLQADDTADPHRPITMTYDPLDRLLAETTSLGTVTYGYDTLGRRTSMTVSGQAPVTYTYDANSRLTGLTQAPLAPVTLQYDAANRRTGLTLPNGVSTESQYDPASRLTALIYRNTQGMLGDLTYQYDAAGNRVGVGGAFARSLIPTAVPSAAYDSANRQLAFGATTMTFDDTGNLATLTDATGTTTYTWDSRNRLTGLTGPTASAQFAYDGHGRRAQKTVGGVSTQFQYDGLDATRELGGAEEATYLRTLNIDETLVRTITGDPAYFLADGLGSTVALADAAGGTPTTYTYAPFGETAVSGAASSNPFHLTGREDDGFGLYYYRARYYDPTRSRFVSEDPFRWVWLRIGELGFFTYSGNNPLKWVDPFGLFYFARRPLGHLPWIPIASQNPLDDYLNTELSHEHGFFEDASGGNVGFGPHGRFTEDPTGRGYRPEGTHYDDARMRRALQNISDGSYSNLLWKKKNNCQDWADRLRAEYRRLEQEDRKKK